MAVPRNRSSNARKNKRRAHLAKKPVCVVTCHQCKASKRPGTICESCGYYGSREIIQVADKGE